MSSPPVKKGRKELKILQGQTPPETTYLVNTKMYDIPVQNIEGKNAIKT